MSGDWIFQGNPDYHDTTAALGQLAETTWLVRQYKSDVDEGDTVYLWETGSNAGLVARCVVREGPRERAALEGEERFYIDADRFAGEQNRALLAITRVVEPRLSRDECLSDPVLSTLPNLRFGNATNFRITPEQAASIEARIGDVDDWPYQPGDVVKRSDLHDRYGGNRQRGISPSRMSPNILVFTDPASGSPHGYLFDGWSKDEPGMYTYTGEGQRGDQQLTIGNLAIVQSAEDGRAIRLLEGAGGSNVRYLGRFAVDRDHPYDLRDAPETAGGPLRKVYVFRLRQQQVTVMRDDFDLAWRDLRSYLEVAKTWVSLVEGSRYELEEFGETSIRYLRTSTGNTDTIGKTELRSIWQAVRASGEEGHIPSTSSRSGLLALHPSIESESGTRRLFYVEPPSHPIGQPRTRGSSRGSLGALAAELCLEPAYLERVDWLLLDRRQIVFYGPPGTGKTYVAEAYAAWLAGPDHVETIQFHPSYAYEDFMEGIRPVLSDEELRYELVDGVFKRLAARAAADPDAPYVLIVDEINRANLSRVFGELLYLLEYRDKAIKLPYSQERFALPSNLYLIGTMNTADRSIALVDFALRRRFHFVPFPADPEILRRWLARERPAMAEVADLLAQVNRELDRHDFSIGFSYFMRRDLDSAILDRVWRGSVLPAIEEFFYNEPDRRQPFELAAVRRAIQQRAAGAGLPDVELAEPGS